MKILVTGGAGFIGSNFIRYWLREHPEDTIVNYDALTYAGNLENVRDMEEDARYTFVHGDIGNYDVARAALDNVDTVVNFAAESHNDRAILDPGIFVKTNVLGTQVLLAAACDAKVSRFHHISTCEVFGELELDEDRMFGEGDPYAPKTPYNASKAAANHVVMAYYHTFKMPITISHCENNYGPYQFPEKVIPVFTTNALEDKPLPPFKSRKTNARGFMWMIMLALLISLYTTGVLERRITLVRWWKSRWRKSPKRSCERLGNRTHLKRTCRIVCNTISGMFWMQPKSLQNLGGGHSWRLMKVSATRFSGIATTKIGGDIASRARTKRITVTITNINLDNRQTYEDSHFWKRVRGKALCRRMGR